MVKQTASGAPRAREGSGVRRSSSASSDHWKRLLRRPPREPVALDAQAFVDELNRRLRADPASRDDTRFVVAGSGAAPTWEGPDSMKPVVARIVKSVIGEFETERPFLFDR
ncbi:MAG TPA: hypothetical protein VLD35_08055 [Caldimonas sp.]|nr:hypothetical protein [Caldimonas sp.]